MSKRRKGYPSETKVKRGLRVVHVTKELEDCHRRNSHRSGAEQIPFIGLLATAKRLGLPWYNEGFDELQYVRIGDDKHFVAEDCGGPRS